MRFARRCKARIRAKAAKRTLNAQGLSAHAVPRLEPESFRDHLSLVHPGFRWYRHVDELSKVAEKIISGELTRVIICMPPGTSKTEVMTRGLASRYLSVHPGREVGIITYDKDLALQMSDEARKYYTALGGELSNTSRAKGNWKTLEGGRVWATGIGSAIRGKRFHLCILDDPHKDFDELESTNKKVKEKAQRFFTRTILNRANLYAESKPAIVIVMQRLHPDDLVGFLMKQPDASEWTVVVFDAIKQASDKAMVIGPGATRWPDWRQEGELLCPDILGHEKLESLKADKASYLAMYLQTPEASSGELLNRAWFRRVAEAHVPPQRIKVLGVDLALTTNQKSDYTCGFPVGISAAGIIYVYRPFWDRVEAPDALEGIVARALESRVRQIGVESVAYQLSFVQHLRRRQDLGVIPVLAVPADKDKIARCKGWAPLAQQGLVYLVDDGTGWVENFLDEAHNFPNGKKDQIDALGIAIEMLQGITSSPTGGAHAA